MTTLADFRAPTLSGDDGELSEHLGSVVLVVNTASECGFTPQYQGLQQLYERYHEQGFTVLGFPCDQFGHQEPGSGSEISDFCRLNFGVGFPMYAKVEVNGAGAHPLWQWLRSEEGEQPGADIEWNFTKFLLGRDGRVIERYAPKTEPAALAGDVEKALGGPGRSA